MPYNFLSFSFAVISRIAKVKVYLRFIFWTKSHLWRMVHNGNIKKLTKICCTQWLPLTVSDSLKKVKLIQRFYSLMSVNFITFQKIVIIWLKKIRSLVINILVLRIVKNKYFSWTNLKRYCVKINLADFFVDTNLATKWDGTWSPTSVTASLLKRWR